MCCAISLLAIVKKYAPINVVIAITTHIPILIINDFFTDPFIYSPTFKFIEELYKIFLALILYYEKIVKIVDTDKAQKKINLFSLMEKKMYY